MNPPIDDSNRTLRQVADETFAQFEQTQPDRARAMAAEINEIAAGRCRSIEVDLDPLSAYHLAGVIDLALTHPRFPDTPRAAMERLYDGIVERLAPQCPELARQLAEGYRQRRENPSPHGANVPVNHPDTARMNWLHNAFMGADHNYGDAIGLTGKWHDLRDAVDRAIEEGR